MRRPNRSDRNCRQSGASPTPGVVETTPVNTTATWEFGRARVTVIAEGTGWWPIERAHHLFPAIGKVDVNKVGGYRWKKYSDMTKSSWQAPEVTLT